MASNFKFLEKEFPVLANFGNWVELNNNLTIIPECCAKIKCFRVI